MAGADELSPTDLGAAIENEDHAEIRRIVAAGVAPDARIEPRETPLTLAAGCGLPDTVRLLVELGADVNYRAASGADDTGFATPLGAAVQVRASRCVAVLLELGADPELGNDGRSPLFDAADAQDIESVRHLIGAGADPFAIGYKMYMPFSRAAGHENFALMEELYVAMRRSDRFQESMRLCLRSVVYDESVPSVLWILERHPRLYNERETTTGEYPVQGAASRGNVALIRLLASMGPLEFRSSPEGRTALMSAVLQGGPEAVRALIEAGDDVHAREHERGYTPLFHACYLQLPYRRHAEIVTILCDHGADVNARDREGLTPVMKAVATGLPDVVEALLRHDPDLRLRDEAGRDVFDLARERGSAEIIRLLDARRGS